MTRVSRWFCGLGLALLLGSALPHRAQAKPVVIERIVAVVNNRILLWSEWRQKYDVLKEKMLQNIIDEKTKQKRADDLRREVLQRMVDDVLLEENARKLQISVSKAEVDAAVADTQRRYKLTDEQFREAQKQQGYTPASYRLMVRRELRKLRLLRRVLREKINVTAQDEKAFYRQMIQDIQTGPAENLIRHILIAVPKDAKVSQRKELKKRADAVLAAVQKALKGSKKVGFVALVKKYSQEPNAAETGGSLGWHKVKFDKDEEPTLPSSLIKAVRKTSPGKIYPSLLKTPLGYHILYVDKRRLSGVLSFEEALPNIRKVLRKRAFERAYQKYVKELRQKAVVQIRLDPAKRASK